MEVSAKERQRAEHLLQSQRIQLHQIESFSFMKRYRRDPHENIAGGKDRYGPGIFVFHLKEKQDRILHMPPFKHPSSLVRFLVSQGIPFANYSPCNRSEGTLPAETYQRPSLYMFWFFILFLMFLILGYFICMLMTRFCYLTLDNDALTVHSVGRTIRYPYTDLRKVNFDFAREQTFTHIMELLDKDYRYRLFYIGRVSRKRLNEIAERLQQAGVDATCSLNDNKRFYQDKRGSGEL